MTQSVELLLDPAGEAQVLQQWRLLCEAGLASQARHTGPSNRPHVTLAAVPALDEAAEGGISAALRGLPIPARLGALAVFGSNPVVLVRLVVASRDLLDLHQAVADAAGTAHEDLSAPGRWVPHVTLAHRMPNEQLLRALELLASDDVPVVFEHARRWDSVARRTWIVG